MVYGNYKPTFKDKDGKEVIITYEKYDENHKKMISKNDEAKMVLYNALPKNEYERIFMCDTAQDIWRSLIITHQGNKQVKDNKIDLFVQKYEEFSISDDETIDCAFARFNTIITSLKALDKSFSSRNHVRKFLRALPTKWRPKYKSLAPKARKVLSEEEATFSDNNDEEYVMEVRDFKKFFRRRGKFVRQPHDDKKNFQKVKEDKKEKDDRRCFKCGDPNHFISDFPKYSFSDQKAFVVGCWSDSEDDSKKEEICLMALDNNEVRLKVKLEPDEWIKDSGCSRHMTGNKDLFSSYKTIDEGNVVFGGNTKSKIIGKAYLTKFDPKPTECIFLEYSPNSKAYIILNKETMRIEESLNVKFDESPHPMSSSLEDDDILECEFIENKEKDLEIKEIEPLNKEIINIKESKDHPLETVIGSGDWNSLKFQDTANSAQKKETNAMYQIDTEEVSDRFVAPCFVNGLEAYDVKRENKVVKKELIVALRGKIYFVKFIINPEEDDVEPGMIFGRSFLCMTKSNDDWDHLRDFNIDDIPLLGEEGLPPFVCKMGNSSRNKKRAMENLNFFYQDIETSSSDGGLTMAYHDKYKKILDELWKDKVELDGKIVKEDEEAIKRIKEEALKEKDDPEAFIFPIRLDGQVNKNALADTRSDINTMPYQIYEQLGRERNHDDKSHSGRSYGILTNVLYQVGETFSTFDGFCHQTIRAARSDFKRNAESDSDDKEDYQIKRNKFGAPIYGPKPAPYLNCNDPDERSLAIQTVTNPF
ncbi:hypothetical protein Tco_0998328 [Tanacetum coccineum]